MNSVLPLHMGALHPVEQVLTLLLAFGPFVVLALVIRHRRRCEDESDEAPSPVVDEASDQRAR